MAHRLGASWWAACVLLLLPAAKADCNGCVNNGEIALDGDSGDQCYAWTGSCGTFEQKSNCWMDSFSAGYYEYTNTCWAEQATACCDTNTGLVCRRLCWGTDLPQVIGLISGIAGICLFCLGVAVCCWWRKKKPSSLDEESEQPGTNRISAAHFRASFADSVVIQHPGPSPIQHPVFPAPPPPPAYTEGTPVVVCTEPTSDTAVPSKLDNA